MLRISAALWKARVAQDFPREGFGIVDGPQPFENGCAVNSERPGLSIGVGEIEDERLQIAVEDPSDGLALLTDDRTL